MKKGASESIARDLRCDDPIRFKNYCAGSRATRSHSEKDGAKVMVLLTHVCPEDKVKPEIPPMRDALQKMVEGEGVPFVVAKLTDHSEYYGGPHANPRGNEAIAEQLAPIIAKVMGRK